MNGGYLAMKKLITILLIVVVTLAAVGVALGATEAQKLAAINAGLAYLASTQAGDGSWNSSGYPPADTGAALLAFAEQYTKPSGWAADYSSNVQKAVTYLLNNATEVDISSGAWWGDTSNDGSNKGIKFGAGSGEESYITGLVLPALCRLVTAGISGYTPGTVIASGNTAVNGLTYAQVIQRTVDLLEWAQNGPSSGVFDGGWRYILPSPNTADNSTSQWPVVGMLYAQTVPGVTVAAQTKAELQNWITYIQNANGGSGYDSPTNIVDESKTGGLLVEMAFAGGGGNKNAAIGYLNTNWLNGPSSTWYGNIGHPYAMWSIYKGLEVTIGLNDMTTITNLPADPGDIDNPNHGWNWWESYCDWLVKNQLADGSWTGYAYWYGALAAAWYINILNATELPPAVIPVAFDIHPGSCPNPIKLGSKGVVPAAICGTDTFDVTQIDPATIKLVRLDESNNVIGEVAPVRWSFEDVATPYLGQEACGCHTLTADGFMDLALKFDTQAVVNNLQLSLVQGQTIPLVIRGNLKGENGNPGQAFEGKDCVRVLAK
jgi:type II secretory pathway pseudopilin PulG